MTGSMSGGNLGTSLAKDHPINFQLPAVDDGEIRLSLRETPPRTGDETVKLFDNSVECITCHEPHQPGRDSATQFMVRSNREGAVCTSCHDGTRGRLAGWQLSGHSKATNVVSAFAGLPYGDPSTVATNACASCHKSHGSVGTGTRLQRAAEEGTCYKCHASPSATSPAANDVAIDAAKVYAHPINAISNPDHDPAEQLPLSTSRHAECADCHNPHASQPAIPNTTGATVPGPLIGTSGVASTDGITATAAAAEYEICFKCHANSSNKPQSYANNIYGPNRPRKSHQGLSDPFNTRLEFLSDVARHNVVFPARGNVAPSLRSNMLTLTGGTSTRSLGGGTYLYCFDCHSSNAATGSNAASAGPHGSIYYHILERRYEYNGIPVIPGEELGKVGYASGVTGPYALCDKCHDVDALVTGTNDQSFGKHNLHVVIGQIACASCHASHGVQSSPTQQYSGTSQYSKGLIDLDLKIGGSTGNPGSPYIDTGSRTCDVRCHGENHIDVKY